ncbi:MAG TPA: cytochrome c [Bacteroidia bacterium]|nr:cytochrome c [Bacteroidia bacterium]
MQLIKRLIFLFYIFNCSFLISCSTSVVKKKETDTFSEHIAPIIYKNCTSCHRPGEAGPFSLLTYKDVASRSKLIRFVTQSRFMPPWPADASYTHFVKENVLTEEEINTIANWVDQGAIQGDSTKMPAVPFFPLGSQLGKPDLVVKLRDVYSIKGNGKDLFLLMRVPFEIPKDTFVRVIEIIPDNRKLVHHVNAQLSYDSKKKKDVFKGNTVVDLEAFPDKLNAYKALGLANDDGVTFPLLTQSVANYLPGVVPPIYPDGIGGFKITQKGALFLKDIHYGPSRVDTTDQTTFNIFYADKKPKRPSQEFQMGTYGVSPTVPQLVIPADSIKKFHSDYTLPFDISVLTINPHMHLLGKSFLAYAVTLQNDTIPMIRIHKWDFRWQYFYTYKKC